MRVAQFEVLRQLDATAAETWLTLRKPISFKAKETPLGEALRQFREATKDGRERLPVYVDPLGLKQVEQDMKSVVDLDVDDAPAASVLDLLIKQLGLKFFVDRDGIIVITCDPYDQEPAEERDLTTLNKLLVLRHQVDAMQREMAVLRRARRVSNGPAAAVPVSGQVVR